MRILLQPKSQQISDFNRAGDRSTFSALKPTESAIFVSNRNYLTPPGGGVQWCTRDYLETISASGVKTTITAYDVDQRLHVRLRRRLRPQPFRHSLDPRILSEIEAVLKTNNSKWVFLNNSEPLALAAGIKTRFGNDLSVIYLSHGVETTDQLNDARLRGPNTRGHRSNAAWLGRLLLTESEQRQYLDGVVCVSDEDLLFERWLGSENPCWLPRPVRSDVLDWKPITGRIGTVATLNHMPNLDGIRRFVAELSDAQHLRFRLIGGPADEGQKLRNEFPFVDYLGQLSEDQLKIEAATWSAFVNPIFCQARGISTKVATALGWGLPVLTTRQGARGYRWDDAVLPRTESPRELAALTIEVAIGNRSSEWRAKARKISRLAPSIEESGKMLQEFLWRVRSDSACFAGNASRFITSNQ